MVGSSGLALPLLVATLLWFVGTGAVAMINRRLRASFARAVMLAGLCGMAGLCILVATSGTLSAGAAYASFIGGLLIWSWHEISFLTGAVSGTHREDCPLGAGRWQRFSRATLALIHHEMALAMTAGLLLSLGAFTANDIGAQAFALLLIFRLSAKLNIYWGVPHFSDELLPQHLHYLKSYFGPRRSSPLLLLSILLISGIAAYYGWQWHAAETDFAATAAGLLCGLSLLAALEHVMMALPVRDSAMWGWALEAMAAQRPAGQSDIGKP